VVKFIIASLSILPIAFGQNALTTAQIAKKVSPSVVVIEGKTDSGDLLGSGFIVSKDGKIVTNLHVIRDLRGASVRLANGEIFDSISIVATDARRDLAIVHVAGFDLPALDLANSNSVMAGEPVVIVGSPRGLQGTVTAGILSGIRDSGDGFKVLQTDAAVNPGNSGGPLVNTKGQAIGVVSFKLRSSEGLNFAVPINYVSGLLNELHEPISLDEMRARLSAKSTAGGPSLNETLDWLKEKIPLAANHFVIVEWTLFLRQPVNP
jgi:serine protease Do